MNKKTTIIVLISVMVLIVIIFVLFIINDNKSKMYQIDTTTKKAAVDSQGVMAIVKLIAGA